jgi:hypothetical protein
VRADGTVLIGTSGWSYRSWRGSFFPDDLPPGPTSNTTPSSGDGIVWHRQGCLEPTWGADAHCCRSGYVFSLANC